MNLHQAIDGRENSQEYAVWAWDKMDRLPTMLSMSIGLGPARDALKEARAADPPFDHILLTKRSVTRTAWVAAPENDLHPESEEE